MKCIVGLGNIGKRFELTRHNIGFEVVDDILTPPIYFRQTKI